MLESVAWFIKWVSAHKSNREMHVISLRHLRSLWNTRWPVRIPFLKCVWIFLMQCKNMQNRFEITSPTARPAVHLWFFRGLCFSLCLPSQFCRLLKQLNKKEPFSIVHTCLCTSPSLCHLLSPPLSLCSDICNLSLSLVNKADFLQCPPAVSCLFFPSLSNIHFFFHGCWQRSQAVPYCTQLSMRPTATNKARLLF